MSRPRGAYDADGTWDPDAPVKGASTRGIVLIVLLAACLPIGGFLMVKLSGEYVLLFLRAPQDVVVEVNGRRMEACRRRGCALTAEQRKRRLRPYRWDLLTSETYSVTARRGDDVLDTVEVRPRPGIGGITLELGEDDAWAEAAPPVDAPSHAGEL